MIDSFMSVCSSLDLSELAKAAKKKLQSVSILYQVTELCVSFLTYTKQM